MVSVSVEEYYYIYNSESDLERFGFTIKKRCLSLKHYKSKNEACSAL